jgi:hypothetical protein
MMAHRMTKARRILSACLAAFAACTAARAESDPPAEPSPPPAETRAESWQRLRDEKRKHLEHYRPTFFERQILAFEKAEKPSILDRNLKGFYPRFRTLSTGSQVAGVLHFWQPDIKGSTLSLHASAAYSWTGYELYDFRFGRVPHQGRAMPSPATRGDDVYELGALPKAPRDRLILYGQLRYRHDPRDPFFGLGQDSRREDRTTFLNQDASYEMVSGWPFGRRVLATAHVAYLQAFTAGGDDPDDPPIDALFDDTTAPGLASQPDFVRISGLFLFDGRDRPFNPHRGGMVALEATQFDDRGSDEFRFHRLAVDTRGYVSLGSPQRVLAVRALASRDVAAEGSRVPFYLMQPISNSHDLRGYETFRFRGEKVLTFQAEYRWEAAPALELALFGDAGRVFRPTEDWTIDGMRGSVGLGLRLKTHDDLLARLEVAKGSEGFRWYLRFGPSF